MTQIKGLILFFLFFHLIAIWILFFSSNLYDSKLPVNNNKQELLKKFQESKKEQYVSKDRPCRVLIMNKVDFHHELIESAVLRFPLPFHEFNCSVKEYPIIYDFALYQSRFQLKISGAKTTLSRNAQFLNQTEFWGWKKYFDTNLKGKVIPKNDIFQSRAVFNELVTFEEMDYVADATIDVTCDISDNFHRWLLSSKSNFCILHKANQEVLQKHKNPSILSRSCFLSPMWPKKQCQFIASDLPFAKDNVKTLRLQKAGIEICVQGANRNFTLACEIFSKSKFKLYNATLHFSSRDSKKLKRIIKNFGIEERVSISNEIDYIKYHQKLSQCDLVLPLKEPSESSTHFPWGNKKSSGIIPAIIAYKIDILAHYKYIDIYKKWFSNEIDATGYGDTVANKVSGLNKKMQKIFDMKKNNGKNL